MGLFGGGRKAAERAEEEERARKLQASRAEIEKSADGWDRNIDEWMDRVEASRPAGAAALTNEVLALTGPCPMPRIPPEHARSYQASFMVSKTRGYATEVALRRGVRVGAAGDLEQSRYWTSVSEYLSGL